MRDETQLSKLTRAMKSRGFTYAGRTPDDWLAFNGSITAAGTAHPTQVAVDFTGLELPRIRVDLPPRIPSVLAHVGADGQICYAAKGSIVLDIFDIAGQTLGCLDRAAEVLDTSLRGNLAKDLEDEFFAYWYGDLCFLDIYPGDSGALDILFSKRGNSGINAVFVTNDVTRTREKLQAMALQEQGLLKGTAFRVSTSAKPKPSQGTWPPATVAALLQWQGLLDPSAKRKIERRLLQAVSSKRHASLCVIDSPLTQYAFWTDFDAADGQICRSRTNPKVKLYSAKIHPMISIRMDDKYVAERNVPESPTLVGKRIALIGCGTIGGFLAELLVKAGAGLNDGDLALVDPDILLPQNVGRHRLGLNRALQYKSNALKEELSLAAPTARVRSLPVRAEDADLTSFDLIVNATGEEALGHYLTRAATDSGKFVPTLSVWVEGPGVAVRALFRDTAQAACTRCLSDTHRVSLYPVVNEPVPIELAGHGCEGLYVPFPASVSVQAACLAIEIVTSWMANQPSPRLRTRVTRHGFSRAASDGDPVRQPTCAACHL
ncbi:ThiF family adenylyltransferase [Bordetella bronchiseptica]|uniref:ThiF family adenylyltransferase n=1 Tax=Bordetella bronchiseptica TaxID=518 RepID=UPI00046112E8|nr:ThiF family adenylyltransferase [Bordetella bronchiseptica]KDC62111.1 ThiF family protein [Bordetella bronchiseptica MBORD591]KDD16018.1 ThiF family protein [Bordetella bronchiseptica MBORD707]